MLQKLKTPYTRSFAASFKADPELWSRFKTECKGRGVSICHVLEALMEAWIQGQKTEATVIRPVTVNLTMEHVVQRPRRVARFQDLAPTRKQLAGRCPECGSQKIAEMEPTGLPYRDGRCKSCGSQWLISPGPKS